MSQFLGEYDCKIDAKGRFRMPAQLVKQLNNTIQKKFVVNRGIEQCLVLYTNETWQKISSEVNDLNLFVTKNRKFVRYFYRGATEILMDKTDRILLPKRLIEYATMNKHIVLFAYNNRIEIWAKEQYENMLNEEPADFSTLAEEVMGKALG